MQVGGYPCPTSGEIAGRDVPADGAYYLTTFGGGSDTQPMACGGTADGTWYYVADSWRFGCGARVLVTNPANGRAVVAQVADVGPNVCVEQAAGGPIIDASPLVAQYLFGSGSRGWSDRARVTAFVVDPSTPLGPALPGAVAPLGGGAPASAAAAAGPTGLQILGGAALAGGLAAVLAALARAWLARREAAAAAAGARARRG